jgi:flagellar motility protein MotE (MotC chaperone)
MTPEQIAKRLAELRELAKQHEAILLQISGAIQEYTNVLAQMSQDKAQEGTENAADQITQQESV